MRERKSPLSIATPSALNARSIPRLVIRGWVTGAVLGAAFAAVLIATNTVGLRDLIQQSSTASVAVPLFMAGFATVVGGLYSAASVMLIASQDR